MTEQETGTESTPITVESGEFYCSKCASRQGYELKSPQKQATSWFFRLFSQGDRGSFVECQNCRSTFVPAVLQVADESFDADYHKGIRRVAIQMMAVDGSIDDEEVAAIKEMFQQLTGKEVDEASIRDEAASLSSSSVDELSEFLSDLAASMNDRGKELILKTAFWVVGADGQFDEEEARFIYRVGGALGISAADVRVLMDRMTVSKG